MVVCVRHWHECIRRGNIFVVVNSVCMLTGNFLDTTSLVYLVGVHLNT